MSFILWLASKIRAFIAAVGRGCSALAKQLSELAGRAGRWIPVKADKAAEWICDRPTLTIAATCAITVVAGVAVVYFVGATGVLAAWTLVDPSKVRDAALGWGASVAIAHAGERIAKQLKTEWQQGHDEEPRFITLKRAKRKASKKKAAAIVAAGVVAGLGILVLGPQALLAHGFGFDEPAKGCAELLEGIRLAA